jgi:hypothetical protein
MNKEVNGFSFAEKVGQSPIEKITKRLFEAQLNNNKKNYSIPICTNQRQ